MNAETQKVSALPAADRAAQFVPIESPKTPADIVPIAAEKAEQEQDPNKKILSQSLWGKAAPIE